MKDTQENVRSMILPKVSQEDLVKKLMAKEQGQGLAHFYILSPSSTSLPTSEKATPGAVDKEESLDHFLFLFFKEFFSTCENSSSFIHSVQDEIKLLTHHPDIFLLGDYKTQKQKAFLVEDIERLSHFLEFKPFQSRRKFVVIRDCSKLNHITSNKLLKILEEPQNDTTIFLTNPHLQNVLPTIHSRAIYLRVPNSSSKSERLKNKELKNTGRINWETFLDLVKKSTLSEFLDIILKDKKDKIDFKQTMNDFLLWESSQFDHHSDAQTKISILEWMVKFEEMESLHQSSQTKWTLFYLFLKNLMERSQD